MKSKTKYVQVPSKSILPDRDIAREPVLECINLGITLGGRLNRPKRSRQDYSI